MLVAPTQEATIKVSQALVCTVARAKRSACRSLDGIRGRRRVETVVLPWWSTSLCFGARLKVSGGRWLRCSATGLDNEEKIPRSTMCCAIATRLNCRHSRSVLNGNERRGKEHSLFLPSFLPSFCSPPFFDGQRAFLERMTCARAGSNERPHRASGTCAATGQIKGDCIQSAACQKPAAMPE